MTRVSALSGARLGRAMRTSSAHEPVAPACRNPLLFPYADGRPSGKKGRLGAIDENAAHEGGDVDREELENRLRSLEQPQVHHWD